MSINLKSHVLSTSKEWLTFTTKTRGAELDFRILSLPENLLENAVDFIMDYYVAREVVHRSFDMISNREATYDYRQIITTFLKDPMYQTIICCLDNGSDTSCTNIVGMSVTKIISKNDVEDEDLVKPKTKAVAEYFEILQLWNSIFSATDFMRKYNVEYMQDDRGLAVHPKYERHGIARKLVQVRLMICRELGIHMSGAWLTSKATQKLAEHDYTDIIFEINSEDIGRQLGITIPDAPATLKYVVVYTHALNKYI